MSIQSNWLSFFASILISSLVHAQWSTLEEARFIGPPPNQGLGTAVAIDGNTAVVGAPGGSSPQGTPVFVYTRSAGVWTEQDQLFASDGAGFNRFGDAVAIDGNTIVVGVPLATVNGMGGAGAVYVFTRSGSTWSEQAKLVAPDALQQAEFGRSVVIDGDTLAIGSPLQNSLPSFPGSGATYVFTRSGTQWTFQQRIVPSGNVYGARSGSSVALVDDTLVVGAPIWFDEPNNHIQAGRVFVFTRTGNSWTQSASFGPSDPSSPKSFGYSVSLSGTRILVGAVGDAPAGHIFYGAAYVFRRSGSNWVQEQKLTGTGINDQDYFGTSVALYGTTAVVGAPGGNSAADAGSGTVRAFDFDGTQWTERLDVTGSATTNGDRLGQSVALDGDTLIAGASTADVPNQGLSGEAYAWRLNPPVVSLYCTAQTNSLGCTPAIAWSGTPSATSPAPFLVTASQVLNNRRGIMIYSLTPASTPFQGGTLCLGAPVRRTGIMMSGGSPSGNDCSGSYAFDLNARIQSGVDMSLVVGQDVYCQYWYRDPGATHGTGLTNALRARIQP